MQSVKIQAATLFHMQFHETIHLLSVVSDEMSARGWSLLHEVVSPRTIIIGWLYTTLYKSMSVTAASVYFVFKEMHNNSWKEITLTLDQSLSNVYNAYVNS